MTWIDLSIPTRHGVGFLLVELYHPLMSHSISSMMHSPHSHHNTQHCRSANINYLTDQSSLLQGVEGGIGNGDEDVNRCDFQPNGVWQWHSVKKREDGQQPRKNGWQPREWITTRRAWTMMKGNGSARIRLVWTDNNINIRELKNSTNLEWMTIPKRAWPRRTRA